MISCRDALTGSAHQVKGHDRRGPRHQETTMPKYLLLENNGEYVDAQALTPARTWVRYGGPDAAPVTTDGPHPETSDLVAGWWLIEVESHERAVELAAYVSSEPGPGGEPMYEWIDVREVMWERPRTTDAA